MHRLTIVWASAIDGLHHGAGIRATRYMLTWEDDALGHVLTVVRPDGRYAYFLNVQLLTVGACTDMVPTTD